MSEVLNEVKEQLSSLRRRIEPVEIIETIGGLDLPIQAEQGVDRHVD